MFVLATRRSVFLHLYTGRRVVLKKKKGGKRGVINGREVRGGLMSLEEEKDVGF